jgi:vitamin B12 transporter
LLIDGVRYGSATAGTPSWDNIPVDMIERIEVLKGPASALYGSEGVGGVVQIFTRRGRQGFHPYAVGHAGQRTLAPVDGWLHRRAGRLDLGAGPAAAARAGPLVHQRQGAVWQLQCRRDGFAQTRINASWRCRSMAGAPMLP